MGTRHNCGKRGIQDPSLLDESAPWIQITKIQGWSGNGDNDSDPGAEVTKNEVKWPMSHQQVIAARGREGHGLMLWDSELKSLGRPGRGNEEQKGHLCSRAFQKVQWNDLSNWGGIGNAGDVQTALGAGHEEGRNDLGFQMEKSVGGTAGGGATGVDGGQTYTIRVPSPPCRWVQGFRGKAAPKTVSWEGLQRPG